MGRYYPGRKRKVLITFQSPWEARLVIAKAIENNLFQEHKVLITPGLSKEDALREKTLLQKRYDMIQNGTDSKTLKQKSKAFWSVICKAFWSVEKNILVLGDFNIPSINWALFPAQIPEEYSEVFNFFIHNGFDQLIHQTTHDGGNILDLCFANFDIQSISVSGKNFQSDHFGITIILETFHLKKWEMPQSNSTFSLTPDAVENIKLDLSEQPIA